MSDNQKHTLLSVSVGAVVLFGMPFLIPFVAVSAFSFSGVDIAEHTRGFFVLVSLILAVPVSVSAALLTKDTLR